jgi:hypothetical protein
MMITMVLIPVLSVGAVFLYKKIRLQKTVALLVVAFSICLCILTGFYWYSIGAKFDGVPVPGIKMVFPLLITVFSVLAYRGIVKDENLLKSYDRLR